MAQKRALFKGLPDVMNASMLHIKCWPASLSAERTHHGGLLGQNMSAVIPALLHVKKPLVKDAIPTCQICSELGNYVRLLQT